MEHKWWKEVVAYQIYPRSFQDSNGDGIGDLKGIITRLDYIKNLGIDVLWLSPIYPSPNHDNGYDISNYEDIMPEFGTMQDFDELLKQTHQRGIKLILDLVVNHTSDQHPWFRESRKSRNNPYRDYYIWKDPVDGHEPTNWGSYAGDSAWKFDPVTGQYYLHQFYESQPDLNWDNPKVREEIFRMMKWWCDKGIDGFRMDVITLLSKPEVYRDGPVVPGEKYAFCGDFTAHGPHEHEYLKEMYDKVLSHYDLLTVGEASRITPEEALKYAGNDTHELNMTFWFDHVDQFNSKLTRWTYDKMKLSGLKSVFSNWEKALDGKAWNALFFENHDQPRSLQRWGTENPKYFKQSAKGLATVLLGLQGTPFIFEGEELGEVDSTFTNIDEVNSPSSRIAYQKLVEDEHIYSKETMMDLISRSSCDTARVPMRWDGTELAGFTTGRPWIGINPNHREINVSEEEKDPDSVLWYYRKLIRLRKKIPALIYGSYSLRNPDDEKMWLFDRNLEADHENKGDHLLVLVSFSEDPIRLTGKDREDIVGAEVITATFHADHCDVIPPFGSAIYRIS